MFRVDYERKKDKPGFSRIIVWQQDQTKSVLDRPQKEVYEDDVPDDEVVKRVTEISKKLNGN